MKLTFVICDRNKVRNTSSHNNSDGSKHVDFSIM